MSEKQGLYPKFKIEHTDGTPVDEGAEYFILRLDEKVPLDERTANVRTILKYADEISKINPKLSQDLEKKYSPILMHLAVLRGFRDL